MDVFAPSGMAAAAQRSNTVFDRLVLEDLSENALAPSSRSDHHHHNPQHRGSNRTGTLRWAAGSPPRPRAPPSPRGEADRDFRRLAGGAVTPRRERAPEPSSKPRRHESIGHGGGHAADTGRRADKSTRVPPQKARGSRSHTRSGKGGKGATELHFDRLQIEAARRGRGTVEVGQARGRLTRIELARTVASHTVDGILVSPVAPTSPRGGYSNDVHGRHDPRERDRRGDRRLHESRRRGGDGKSHGSSPPTSRAPLSAIPSNARSVRARSRASSLDLPSRDTRRATGYDKKRSAGEEDDEDGVKSRRTRGKWAPVQLPPPAKRLSHENLQDHDRRHPPRPAASPLRLLPVDPSSASNSGDDDGDGDDDRLSGKSAISAAAALARRRARARARSHDGSSAPVPPTVASKHRVFAPPSSAAGMEEHVTVVGAAVADDSAARAAEEISALLAECCPPDVLSRVIYEDGYRRPDGPNGTPCRRIGTRSAKRIDHLDACLRRLAAAQPSLRQRVESYATTSPPRPSRVRSARSATAASSVAVEPRVLFGRGRMDFADGDGEADTTLWATDAHTGVAPAATTMTRQRGASVVPHAPVKQRTYVDLTDPAVDTYEQWNEERPLHEYRYF